MGMNRIVNTSFTLSRNHNLAPVLRDCPKIIRGKEGVRKGGRFCIFAEGRAV